MKWYNYLICAKSKWVIEKKLYSNAKVTFLNVTIIRLCQNLKAMFHQLLQKKKERETFFSISTTSHRENLKFIEMTGIKLYLLTQFPN